MRTECTDARQRGRTTAKGSLNGRRSGGQIRTGRIPSPVRPARTLACARLELRCYIRVRMSGLCYRKRLASERKKEVDVIALMRCNVNEGIIGFSSACSSTLTSERKMRVHLEPVCISPTVMPFFGMHMRKGCVGKRR